MSDSGDGVPGSTPLIQSLSPLKPHLVNIAAQCRIVAVFDV